MNIKISSLEGDTVFLLPALTSLCVQHFFPPVIMWQAIFNICLNIFCISLWSRKQFCEACPQSALPWQQQCRAQLFHLSAIWALAGSGRSRAGLSLAAQGRDTCLEHMVLQAPGASREAQCEEQLLVPALGWWSWSFPSSRGRPKVRKFPAPSWVLQVESPWPLREKGLVQHPGTACKQWWKLRRGFHTQAGSWECCPSLCQAVLEEEEVTLRNAGEGRLQYRECCTHTLWGLPRHQAIPGWGCMEQEQASPSWLPCLSQTRAPKNTETHPMVAGVSHCSSVPV